MSTYLLGWAIHDFERINSTVKEFGMWVRGNSTYFKNSPILNEGLKVYSELEKWMPLKNPVKKFDHFAVPDFYFSAMENWGFITFRESVGRINFNEISFNNLYNNLVTIGHEYTHTWFGNLVTPEFWSYAWLKEGFSTYFSYQVLSHLYKEWNIMDLFIVDNLQTSLLSDSYDHNRTMNGHNVDDPKSTINAMDFVTYKKGYTFLLKFLFIIKYNFYLHYL